METHFTSSIKIVLRDDGIIETRSKENEVIEINLVHAKENVEKLKEIQTNHPYLFVHISNGQITQEARNYFGTVELNFEKVAIIAKGYLQTLVGNFFLGFNKPRTPIRLFKSEEKALEWIKK